MKLTTLLRNDKCIEWELNLAESVVFSWLYGVPSWAKSAQIEGEIFYFAARTKAIEELPFVTDRPDTMYRHYKSLQDKGLLVLKKIDNKDFIQLTDKGRGWNEVGNISEHSEKNPSQLGKKSEKEAFTPYYNDKITIDALFRDFLSHLNKKTGRAYRGDSKSRAHFSARLKSGWKPEDFVKAIDNACSDAYHIETKFKYITPEFMTREDKLDRFCQSSTPPKPTYQKEVLDPDIDPWTGQPYKIDPMEAAFRAKQKEEQERNAG